MKVGPILLIDPVAAHHDPVRKLKGSTTQGSYTVEQVGVKFFATAAANAQMTVPAWIIQQSTAAVENVAEQLRELCQNPAYQPVYIKWKDSVASNADGWYMANLEDVDYRWLSSNAAEVSLRFQHVADTGKRRGVSWSGAALTSTLAGTPQYMVGIPPGAIAQGTQVTRIAAEGSALAGTLLKSAGVMIDPTTSPDFTRRVRVFDRMGANAVPSTGAFTNTSWVEVFGPKHNYTGDMIVTNGLLLILFSSGATPQVYWWDEKLGTPAWALMGALSLQGDGGAGSRNLLVQTFQCNYLNSERATISLFLNDTASGYQGTQNFTLERNARHTDVVAYMQAGNAYQMWTSLSPVLTTLATDGGSQAAGADAAITNPTTYGVAFGTSATNHYQPLVMSASTTGYRGSTTTLYGPITNAGATTRAGFGILPATTETTAAIWQQYMAAKAVIRYPAYL